MIIGTESDRSDVALGFTCLAGLSGALILLISDFLLYANFGPLSAVAPAVEFALGPRKVIVLSGPAQLLVSNLLCPLVAVLYVIGAWHLARRLRSASDRWSKVTAALFALLAVMSCVYHAMWSQFAFIAQHTNQAAGMSDSLFAIASSNMKRTLEAATVVGLPTIVLMLALVVGGKSSYPRWTIALNPFLIYAIATPILRPLAAALPTPFGALILSSVSEVTMAVFFVMSWMTLRRQSR